MTARRGMRVHPASEVLNWNVPVMESKFEYARYYGSRS